MTPATARSRAALLEELIGLSAYTQFIAPDARANALGMVTSNGMETLIGTEY